MCWIGVLWPQEIWSRVRPKTAAILSRSSGLGVHRPRTMAKTRCSSSPDNSASFRASIPRSRHNRSTPLGCASAIVDPQSLRAATELWAVAIDVRDLRRVAPGDLLGRDTKRRGQAPPLFRARRVAAVDDRFDDALVEAGLLDEIGHGQSAFGHPVGDGFGIGHVAPLARRVDARGRQDAA